VHLLLQALNKEISAKQAQLITLTQASDNISQGLTMEVGTALKGRVTEMKAKVSKLAEDVRQRLNTLSDTMLARSVTLSHAGRRSSLNVAYPIMEVISDETGDFLMVLFAYFLVVMKSTFKLNVTLSSSVITDVTGALVCPNHGELSVSF